MKLVQKKNFKTTTYLIEENRLLINESTHGQIDEFEIPFQEWYRTKLNHKSSNNIQLVLGGVLTAVGLLYLSVEKVGDNFKFGFILTGLIFLILYWRSKHEIWKLKLGNNTYLFLHKAIPNEEHVNQFLTELYDKRDKFLIKEYGNINGMLSYENLFNNFNYLKNLEVISDSAYEEKLLVLNKMYKIEKNTIGFKNKDDVN